MKKIGKKCSKFTKLLIVFGMLFTNLSPLSIVFAESVNSDVTVSVNNDKLNVNYLGDKKITECKCKRDIFNFVGILYKIV